MERTAQANTGAFTLAALKTRQSHTNEHAVRHCAASAAL